MASKLSEIRIMRWLRTADRLLPAALGLLVLATAAVDRARAVTQLHDPTLDHTMVVYGATNGQGANRGPWVVQVEGVKDEFLYVRIDPVEPNGFDPTLRAISGDGNVYFARLHSAGAADICMKVTVSGWVTVHVDYETGSEQRVRFEFSRRASCVSGEDPPH
jgi:hypothetical protein